MKRCPSCGAEYADVDLNFCLNDGTPLELAGVFGVADSEETVVMFQPETSSAPPRSTQYQTPPPPKKGSSGVVKVLIGLVVVGLLFLVVAGAGAAAFFYFGGASMLVKDDPPPTPKPKPAQPDKKGPNKQLQEELADLQKQIEEQNTGQNDYNVELPIDLLDPRPATVNSPNDGFLALRSLPNSEIGTRLAKIPHGETITIGMCIDAGKAGGKKGNWCMARYEDKTGWVFDAFLIIPE